MAKKTLNEATIRRFQKLANVAPLNEMYHKRDEEMEEGMHSKDEDMHKEGMYAKDEDMHEQEDMEADADTGADDAGAMDGDLELTDEEAQAIIDLGAKLEAAMGADDMGGDDMDADPDMGGDADMGGDDMGEEELMEALRGISYVPSQGEIVNEVAQRVARRLKQAKLHEAKLNRALGKRR
tara:strand:+ start:643 stop:1185 length:543 start_codon:yes stop_codon:yes gene_type:complete